MIAIDTNILLRYLLRDDEIQFQRVIALFERAFEEHVCVFISDIVIVETIWCLTGGKVQCTKQEVYEVVLALLSDSRFTIENKALIFNMINDVARTNFSCDYADALIYAKAIQHQRNIGTHKGNRSSASLDVYTFDKRATRLGMKLL